MYISHKKFYQTIYLVQLLLTYYENTRWKRTCSCVVYFVEPKGNPIHDMQMMSKHHLNVSGSALKASKMWSWDAEPGAMTYSEVTGGGGPFSGVWADNAYI